MKKDIVCPAGVRAGEGCHCRIEGSFISPHERSLAGFCESRYGACSSWRADKEASWAGNHSAIIDSDRRKTKHADDYSRAVAAATKRRLDAFAEGDDDTAAMTIDDLIKYS